MIPVSEQSELWYAVKAPAAAKPTPLVGLAVSGMNDVLNSQGYTQVAWWNRIPIAAHNTIRYPGDKNRIVLTISRGTAT